MTWRTISCKAFIAALSQPQPPFRLLDIRGREQFDTAHVRGSQHYDCLRLRHFAEQASPDTPLVLICRRGRTSRHAAMWLDQLGFTAIHSLEDGIDGIQQCAPELLVKTEKES